MPPSRKEKPQGCWSSRQTIPMPSQKGHSPIGSDHLFLPLGRASETRFSPAVGSHLVPMPPDFRLWPRCCSKQRFPCGHTEPCCTRAAHYLPRKRESPVG